VRRFWANVVASSAFVAALAGCGGARPRDATYATTAGACGTLALAVAEAHEEGDLEAAERDLAALRGICDRALDALDRGAPRGAEGASRE
jgi:hypothetical protein